MHAPRWPAALYHAAIGEGAQPERLNLVAHMEDGTLAGFLMAVLVPPEAEIESVAVTAAFQRLGVGRQLVLAGCAAARERGCARMFLEVRTSNEPARALYGALGVRGDGSASAVLLESAGRRGPDGTQAG